MCAHFIVIPRDELERMVADIRNILRAEKHDSMFASYEHAYPKSEVPVLVSKDNNLNIQTMMWGYPPTGTRASWQKEVLFNTKIETALGEKPSMWDNSIKQRRCIIPSFGFYEPHMTDTHLSPKTGKPIKDQYFFQSPGCDVVWMAGIYEDDFFSIMTTSPNKWIKSIHRRMPVVLRPEELNTWLCGDYTILGNRDDFELVNHKVA